MITVAIIIFLLLLFKLYTVLLYTTDILFKNISFIPVIKKLIQLTTFYILDIAKSSTSL